jgi:hypothetical protein
MGLFHKLRPKCGPVPGCGPFQALFHRVLAILDMTSLQTMQYIAFLYAFQTLVSTFHTPNARWFTKYLENTITDATFDEAENVFSRIRRPSDVYEWLSTVTSTRP